VVETGGNKFGLLKQQFSCMLDIIGTLIEYNILDSSDQKYDSKGGATFHKLIDDRIVSRAINTRLVAPRAMHDTSFQ
jgi:hypothetical protein